MGFHGQRVEITVRSIETALFHLQLLDDDMDCRLWVVHGATHPVWAMHALIASLRPGRR